MFISSSHAEKNDARPVFAFGDFRNQNLQTLKNSYSNIKRLLMQASPFYLSENGKVKYRSKFEVEGQELA